MGKLLLAVPLEAKSRRLLALGSLVVGLSLILQLLLHFLKCFLLFLLDKVYIFIVAKEVTHQGNLVSDLLLRAVFVLLFVLCLVFSQFKSLIVNLLVFFISLEPEG